MESTRTRTTWSVPSLPITSTVFKQRVTTRTTVSTTDGKERLFYAPSVKRTSFPMKRTVLVFLSVLFKAVFSLRTRLSA